MNDITPVLTKAGEEEILSKLDRSARPQYIPDMGVRVAIKGSSKKGTTLVEVSVINRWGIVMMTYPEVEIPPNGYVSIQDFAKVTVT